MRYLAYNVRCSLILINSLLLAVKLYHSVVTTHYIPFYDIITELDCNYFTFN